MPSVISCVEIACLVDLRQYLLSMLESESLYICGRALSPPYSRLCLLFAANAP
jgi:hypothetical protein